MLTLPIKKKWFDMILSGEKKEEYREITSYYQTRFRNVWGVPEQWNKRHLIKFRNGYNPDSPTFIAECTLSIGCGNPEWGAAIAHCYYILNIKEVDSRSLW